MRSGVEGLAVPLRLACRTATGLTGVCWPRYSYQQKSREDVKGENECDEKCDSEKELKIYNAVEGEDVEGVGERQGRGGDWKQSTGAGLRRIPGSGRTRAKGWYAHNGMREDLEGAVRIGFDFFYSCPQSPLPHILNHTPRLSCTPTPYPSLSKSRSQALPDTHGTR